MLNVITLYLQAIENNESIKIDQIDSKTIYLILDTIVSLIQIDQLIMDSHMESLYSALLNEFYKQCLDKEDERLAPLVLTIAQDAGYKLKYIEDIHTEYINEAILCLMNLSRLLDQELWLTDTRVPDLIQDLKDHLEGNHKFRTIQDVSYMFRSIATALCSQHLFDVSENLNKIIDSNNL